MLTAKPVGVPPRPASAVSGTSSKILPLFMEPPVKVSRMIELLSDAVSVEFEVVTD